MFKNRAAAAFSAIFLLGVVFSALTPFSAASSFCAALVGTSAISAAAGFLVRRGNMKYKRVIAASAFAVAVFALGALRLTFSAMLDERCDRFDGVYDEVTVSAASVARYEGVCVVEGSVVSSDAGVYDGAELRVNLYGDDIAPVFPGDEVAVSVSYRLAEKLSYRADGVVLVAYGEAGEITKGSGVFYTVRSAIASSCENVFSDPGVASVAKAVTVGYRADVDPMLTRAYSSAGLSHILAISGLHISFIAAAIYGVLRFFGVDRRIGGAVSAVFALFYAFLVGFTPGAARAALMMCFLMLGRVFVRRADSVTSLFASLLLLLLLNPYSAFSPGLQMSFLCCLGIIAVAPRLSYFRMRVSVASAPRALPVKLSMRCGCAAVSTVAVSVAALAFSFPAIYYTFDAASWLSPIMNIFALPAFSAALVIGLIALPVGLLLPSVGAVIAFPAGALLKAVTSAAKAVDGAGFGVVSLRSGAMIPALAVAVAGVAVTVAVRKDRLRAMAFAVAAFLLTFGVCAAVNRAIVASRSTVEYGAGAGEYAYISSGGENIYFDLGGTRVCDDCVFCDGLPSLGVYVVVSPDEKALSRFSRASAAMKISAVMVPSDVDPEEFGVISQIKQLANRRKCGIIEYEGDISLSPGDSSVTYSASNGTLFFDHGGATAAVLLGSEGAKCSFAVLSPGSDVPLYEIDCDRFFLPRSDRFSLPADDRYIFDERIRLKTDGNGGMSFDEPRYS